MSEKTRKTERCAEWFCDCVVLACSTNYTALLTFCAVNQTVSELRESRFVNGTVSVNGFVV